MAFDLDSVRRAVAEHGRVARVVVAETAGSVPREVGASMLVWNGGQSGTIGGGALELEAARQAFARQGATRHPLGPSLGQCCGGAVTLWTETFDAGTLPDAQVAFARGAGDMPLAVKRRLDQARGQGKTPRTELVQGWLIEPVAKVQTPLWVWGAGHVGRAIVSVIEPLGEFDLTWIDTAPDRFPDRVPAAVTTLPAVAPDRLVRHAPAKAHHLVLTYSHELDFRLCDALLRHGFAFAGLIGSQTKWARFRKRLGHAGHDSAQINRICCPIGQKTLGKAPQAIAIGVAAQILEEKNKRDGAPWEIPFSASGA